MHEAGIAQNILRIVEEAARVNRLSRVKTILLEIGQFSGVGVEALEFAFDALSGRTILEGAEIVYQTPPLVLFCINCQNEYLADCEDLRCPACMGTESTVVQGQELVVKSIIGQSDGD